MNRRELLAGLGVASASTLLAAFGCGGARQQTASAHTEAELRTQLREIASRLAATYSAVHVLAVARRHTIAAIDVLGTGVAHSHREGAVLRGRATDGTWREEVTSDLTRAGLVAAMRQLIGSSQKQAPITIPRVPAALLGGRFDEPALRERLAKLAELEQQESRIVYAASLIEIDDATVWSIAPDHDREQQLVRTRESVVRTAWHGSRPVTGEAHRAWLGPSTARLDAAAIALATERALELMTPGKFVERKTAVLLDPSVAATLIDAVVRSLRGRAALGTQLASPVITVVDDPTARGAYGGFAFDDAGVVAQRLVLVEAGKLVGTLGAGRSARAGHVGTAAPSASHLVIARGAEPHDKLLDEGLRLEGGTHALVDGVSGRVVIGAARARELKGGKPTGRVYPEVELVGELATVLASASAASSNVGAFGFRELEDDEPRWRSIESPWLRVEGVVRARSKRA